MGENDTTSTNPNPASPLKAIRAKCLDCSCGSSNEVKLCPVTKCALYPFRFGKNPYRKHREYTPDELEQLRARMEIARNFKNS